MTNTNIKIAKAAATTGKLAPSSQGTQVLYHFAVPATHAVQRTPLVSVVYAFCDTQNKKKKKKNKQTQTKGTCLKFAHRCASFAPKKQPEERVQP